jgi:UPF0755 protein
MYGLIIVTLIFIYSSFIMAPSGYPSNTTFSIKPGETISEVAERLKERKFIKSEFLFKNLTYIFGGKSGVRSGSYAMLERKNIFEVAYTLSSGKEGSAPVRLLVTEGMNVFQIADEVERVFDNISKEEFLEVAAQHEGYLFPETYFFSQSSSASEIVEAMVKHFEVEIEPLMNEILASKRSRNDIIIMASIIEEEARLLETKKIVSGILWKRLDEGIPLQVDAAFSYVNGKTTFELTLDDLKQESPYNTYVNKGLPPTPIANPGIDSIVAALNPINTKYYFYLTDRNGVMRYAETHDGHVANKDRYLR